MAKATFSKSGQHSGFTLIELSIVLVIIGLIVGGVLVGQDLIAAAAVRAQISQIEKYNTAVNTFYGKYGALPGDLNATVAAQFNFIARGSPSIFVGGGGGDGNGLIQGYCCGGTTGIRQNSETTVFWVDLSQVGLIDGGFNTANMTSFGTNPIVATQFPLYWPQAKIGGGNYVYVYNSPVDGYNYFGLSGIQSIDTSGSLTGIPSLTVQQAYKIDLKTDDGIPQTGRVLAKYIDGYESNDPGWVGYTDGSNPSGTSVSGAASTCFDNGGNASSPMQYTLLKNNGAGVNCALSFRFQ